jgi:hypothetical protein
MPSEVVPSSATAPGTVRRRPGSDPSPLVRPSAIVGILSYSAPLWVSHPTRTGAPGSYPQSPGLIKPKGNKG